MSTTGRARNSVPQHFLLFSAYNWFPGWLTILNALLNRSSDGAVQRELLSAAV
jgi:hypothetical protein